MWCMIYLQIHPPKKSSLPWPVYKLQSTDLQESNSKTLKSAMSQAVGLEFLSPCAGKQISANYSVQQHTVFPSNGLF